MEHLRRVTMDVYVRSWDKKELPTQEEVENVISNYLLGMPRKDKGVVWDVSATSIPDPAQVLEELIESFPWNLCVGDKVHWTDPDGNVGRVLEIENIRYITAGMRDCIIEITHKSGYLEVLPQELRKYDDGS